MKYLSLFSVFVTLNSCVVQNPKPEKCITISVNIKDVIEGPGFDLIFIDQKADRYYINRGLEQGLNVDAFKKLTLNKTVRLHLPNFWIGTSEHIAQIETINDTLFTEF